jgi:predicted Na+-dependent transporter
MEDGALTTVADANVTEQLILTSSMKEFYDIIIPTTLAITMLAMGCGVSWEDFKLILKKPIGPAIG